jgi:hypothetical protein
MWKPLHRSLAPVLFVLKTPSPRESQRKMMVSSRRSQQRNIKKTPLSQHSLLNPAPLL